MDEREPENKEVEDKAAQEQDFDKSDKAIREWGRKLWLDIKNNAQSTKFWMEFLALVVLGVYTTFTAFQWCEIREANKTAQEQIGLLKKQLGETDRPWIKIISASGSPPYWLPNPGTGLEFSGTDGLKTGLKLVVKNIGRSVALDITVKKKLIFPEQNGKRERQSLQYPVEQQRLICSDNKPVSPVSFDLFPEEDSGDRLQLHDFLAVPPLGSGLSIDYGVKLIMPMYVGCVIYKIASSGEYHQTEFVYDIQERNPLLHIPFALLRVGKNVALSDLIMVEYPFGGFDAN